MDDSKNQISLEGSMKHFLVEVTYSAPLEQVLKTRNEHREYLKTGYKRKWLLLSGAQSSKTGGVVIARAPSLEDLEAFFKEDPYWVKGLATFRFVEFELAMFQDFLQEWLA
jgi:uncharacterized protein YciI